MRTAFAEHGPLGQYHSQALLLLVTLEARERRYGGSGDGGIWHKERRDKGRRYKKRRDEERRHKEQRDEDRRREERRHDQ